MNPAAGPAVRPAVRRALVRHAALTGLVALVLSTITVGGIWLFAHDEAYRTAREVSGRIATAVGVTLTQHHYARAELVPRDRVLADLSPFVASGMVVRFKIWRVDGDQVEIVVSDEPRVEGERRRFDAGLGRRLDAGEIVVLPVPDDPEHRYERTADATLLEAFVGFRDATGLPMRLEVYVPVDTAATVRYAMGALLPLVLGGLLVLAAATVPLTVGLARRVERDQRERQAVLHYGLAASDRERRELAQQLHDGVVQDLAGTGLLLDALRREEPAGGRRALLDRAHSLVEHDIARLRALLTELSPAGVGTRDVHTALQELTTEFRGEDVTVDITVAPAARPDPRAALLLHRIARELLRNAVRHGAPQRVGITVDAPAPGRVGLTVTDDGRGFDPAAPPPPGHIGLRLVDQVAEEHGGRLTVRSAPGEGTTAAVTLPAVLPTLGPETGDLRAVRGT